MAVFWFLAAKSLDDGRKMQKWGVVQNAHAHHPNPGHSHHVRNAPKLASSPGPTQNSGPGDEATPKQSCVVGCLMINLLLESSYKSLQFDH